MDIGALLGVLIGAGLLATGVWCLLRYARTRDRRLLAIGLVLSLVVVGVAMLVWLRIPPFDPPIDIVYAPPDGF